MRNRSITKPTHLIHNKQMVNRDAKFVEMYDEGMSINEIAFSKANKNRLSPQRIHQIIKLALEGGDE